MKRYRRAMILFVLALVALPAAVALAKKAPVVLGGSVWDLGVKVQMKLQKLGSMKDTSEVWLYLGPSADPALAADEFLVVSDDGPGLGGTWSDPKGKGSLVLDFDFDQMLGLLEDNVTEILGQEFSSVDDVVVAVTKLQAKCKVKPGKSASFSLKVNFTGSATVDSEHVEGKGSFSAKGKGVEGSPPPP